MIVQYIVRDIRIIAYLQFFHPNNYEDVVETIEMNAREFLIDKRSTFEFVRYLTNFDLIKLFRLYDEELEKLETYLSFRFNGNFGNYTNDRVSSEQVELIRQYVIRKSTETFSFDEPTPASS